MRNEQTSFGDQGSRVTHSSPVADAEPSPARRQSKRKASSLLSPNVTMPSEDGRDHAMTDTHARDVSTVKNSNREANEDSSPMGQMPLEDAAGQGSFVTHNSNAGGVSQICDELREQHRQRQDLHRAEKSLTLQIRAKCRRLAGGDKAEADKIYDAMFEKGDHPLASIAMMANLPFLEARKIIEGNRKPVEKRMVQLAKSLPVASWVEQTKGFGLPGLAAIIGECGDLSNYAGPAKVWKRMGLAVMPDGGRQRRVAGAAAIDHGYSAVRRSIVWNCGACIVKSKGPLRELYDRRKAFEIEKAQAAGLEVRPAAKIPKKNAAAFMSAGHIHNRSQRYVEKRLLRDLWRAWTGAGTPWQQ